MLQALFDQTWLRLIALPFAVCFLLAAALRRVGRSDQHGASLAGAAIAIAFAWSAAAELGAPLFPPTASDNALFYLMAAALVLAMPFDLFTSPQSTPTRYAEAAVAILFGLGASIWMRGEADLWTGLVLICWSVVVVLLHRLAEAPPLAAAALVLTALGLAATAWAANLSLERNLAFALASAAAGYFVLSLIDRGMAFAAAAVLGGAGALMVLALRLVTLSDALIPSIIIVGFIYFADTPLAFLFAGRPELKRWLMPFLIAALALLPIGLAALAAYIGIGYEAV